MSDELSPERSGGPLVAPPDIAHLVAEGREIRLAIRREDLDQLARLALEIDKDRVLRRGGRLTPRLVRAYESLEDEERVALRNTMRDTILALVLLQMVELGDAIGGT